MYSLRETAKILGVKVRTLRDWLRSGKLVAEKNESGRWRVSAAEIARLSHDNKD